MNRKPIRVCLILAVLLIMSVVRAEQADKNTPYEDTVYHFKLQYPGDLMLSSPENPRILFELSDRQKDVPRIDGVFVKHESDRPLFGISIAQAADGDVKSMQRAGITVLESSQSTLGGKDSWRIVYTNPLQLGNEQVQVKGVMNLFFMNSLVYSLEIRATDKTYDAFLPIAQKVVNNFQFTEETPGKTNGITPQYSIKSFDNKDESIHFDYPADWTLLPANPKALAMLRAPAATDKKQFRNLITLLAIPPKVASQSPSLAATTQSLIDQLGSTGDILESEAINLNDKPAHKLVYQSTINGVLLKTVQIISEKDDKTYVLTFHADPANFENFKPVVNAVIESFRWQASGSNPASQSANAVLPTTQPTQIFSSNDYGFKLNYPSAWHKGPPPHSHIILALYPHDLPQAGQFATESFSVEVENDISSKLDDAAQQVKETLAKQLNAVITSEEKILVDGQPALKLVSSIQVGTTSTKVIQILVLNQKCLLTFSYLAKSDVFQASQPAISTVLDSVKWTK